MHEPISIVRAEVNSGRFIIRAFLRLIEFVCWSLGSVLIIWVMWTLWSAHRFQIGQAEQLKQFEQTPNQARVLHRGDVFGKISIPRLGMSAIVMEGVDPSTLRQAVGHFPESSVPENGGTVALAGHRDTFFRSLAHVRLEDQIILETPRGNYTYRVVHTEVVGPQHVEVINSSPQSDLTLVTCFPFRYVGRAPERFIVQAARVRTRSDM